MFKKSGQAMPGHRREQIVSEPSGASSKGLGQIRREEQGQARRQAGYSKLESVAVDVPGKAGKPEAKAVSKAERDALVPSLVHGGTVQKSQPVAIPIRGSSTPRSFQAPLDKCGRRHSTYTWSAWKPENAVLTRNTHEATGSTGNPFTDDPSFLSMNLRLKDFEILECQPSNFTRSRSPLRLNSPEPSPADVESLPDETSSMKTRRSAELEDERTRQVILRETYVVSSPLTSSSGSGIDGAERMNPWGSRNCLYDRQPNVRKTLTPSVPMVTDSAFVDILNSVKSAISSGIQPDRIGKGSSGSYFARESESAQVVAVFKPKNEGPYGIHNPKWTKWFHRTFCWCFFGRGCLLPDAGYISEAAASLIDRRLGLFIVPRTEVVYLSSTSFYYARRDQKQPSLPEKIGSFQLFLQGFRDATMFFQEHPIPSPAVIMNSFTALERFHLRRQKGVRRSQCDELRRSLVRGSSRQNFVSGNVARDNNGSRMAPESRPLSGTLRGNLGDSVDNIGCHHLDQTDEQLRAGGSSFQSQTTETSFSEPCPYAHSIWDPTTQVQLLEEFQKLVVLDYTIRNTDRSLDNWMVSYQGPYSEDLQQELPLFLDGDGECWCMVHPSRIRLAGIDNGLAFPYKHPDEWRSYPYGWLGLPIACLPFTQDVRSHLLPILTSPIWWYETTNELRRLFGIDPSFEQGIFEQQVAIMKGQVWNLIECLKEPQGSPITLCARPPATVWEDDELVEVFDHPEGREDECGSQEADLLSDDGDRGMEALLPTTGSGEGSGSGARARPQSSLRGNWEKTREKLHQIWGDTKSAPQRLFQRVKRIEFHRNRRAWFTSW